ncbi:type III-A CRISPR-associated protein Csm2 [Desulfobotulus alkaliphilus]|uniref:type III-A CRISPR-associated protein Csm2 n=1 Tax=Desulfobotulus alkaliphilus TaxID=622671 RepID=UPI001645FC39|nr:type III-A CRISPR-associated protein Csm2 [Desulfobotulus alkaliphilus]
MNAELFSKEAERMAEKLGNEGKNFKGKIDKNKSSQIRKFYDELVRLADEVRHAPERWPLIEPRVHMLVAKAAYASGRGLVSDGFRGFIQDGATSVSNPEELQIWKDYFESIIGFFKMKYPKD